MIEFLKIAEEAARAADIDLKATQQVLREAKQKGGIDDIVSSADLESDSTIVSQLKETPFNILSEESGFTDRKSKFTWIVDSLDGSANYINQIPYYGVSIGLAEGNRPIGGVIYDPVNDILHSALIDNGAQANGKSLLIEDKEIELSILNSDFGRGQKEDSARLIKELAERSRYVRVCGSAVLAMVDLAAGRSQAYVHLNLKAWDGCAGAAIIREAGGIVTNKVGQPWTTDDPSFFAASPKIHRQIMDLIQSQGF